MEVLGSAGNQSSGQVWIENHPTYGWAPGRVDSVGPSGAFIVVDEQGEQFTIPQEEKKPVDPACLRGVDDLLSLGEFNEGALLHNVRVRYFRDDIYTGIGAPILISVNPFAKIPGLYDEKKQKFYREAGQDAELPPHLFSVGAASCAAMFSDGKNQSIIISGESGAGKTEATKRILTYLSNLKRQDDNAAAGKNVLSIEDQVLRSNPILEAFGNAKTLRNDNSSRFGKYIDIEFDAGGKLSSARISNYLLEKSRIVRQQPDERGYHAFYQLCAGGVEALGLQDPSSHNYTCGCVEIDGVDDRSEFEEMAQCMVGLGFSEEERNSVFKITAAVVQLGDLEFAEMADSAEGSKILDMDKAAKICELLGMDIKNFAKIYQFKTLEDPFTKKIIERPQSPVDSSNTRHSMAKCVYSRLFDWLVWRINESTKSKTSAHCKRIGILDIYGFEVFEWNSFEQLCINFANEKLQQHFNAHMFTMEQQLYTEEGISWSHITWQDNREIIDTLEKKPLGLFCILDSECVMPNGKDETCLSKIHTSFKASKIVYKPSRFASTTFAVAHYAGPVVYDIISFLEKNTDKLHADIINLGKTSNMSILKSLFSDPKFAPEMGSGSAKAKPATKPAAKASGGDRAKQNVTVSMMFRQQLDQLVEDLNKTNPRYIRCIKPNPNKQPHEFDSLDVQRQLRCAGMLESIRIRRAGYSVRKPFKEFFNRYRVLVPTISTGGRVDPDYKELCQKLLSTLEARFEQEKRPLEAKVYQVGRSKVFMKEELQARLEQCMSIAVLKFVVRIQKVWRGYMRRKVYKQMRKAAAVMQMVLRTARAAANYRATLRRTQACISLQATLRTFVRNRGLARRRAAAIAIQRRVRGRLCRRKIGKLKGDIAKKRIEKLREEEAQREALETAKREAAETKKAMEEMQRQQAVDRERAQEEARRQLEEQHQAKMAGAQSSPAKQEVQDSKEVEQMRQEMLQLRKENARLEGQLECQPLATGGTTSDQEVELLRSELQDLRRVKVKLEVDLATAKSTEEYEKLLEEANELRDQMSGMRREKLEVDLLLEQKAAQLDSFQAQAVRSEQVASDLSSLKKEHDDLQVQFQRVQAQKQAFEERATGDEVARNELRELRIEKIRLEGELQTSKMKEEAISEKLRSSEKLTLELQTQRQRVQTLETELEVSRKQETKLGEQLANMQREGSDSRNSMLDNLRTELLSQIDSSKPLESGRPSIIRPLGSVSEEGGGGDFGDGGERKTLMNQRQLFEQIKQQFSEAQGSAQPAPEDLQDVGGEATVQELETLLKDLRKENVELSVKVTGLQEELKEKVRDASHQLQSSGSLQAEVVDTKEQLELKAAEVKRQAAQIAELHSKLYGDDGELAVLKSRLLSTEERVVRAEEDCRTAQMQAKRLDQERERYETRVRECQGQAAEAVRREQEVLADLEGERQLVEHCRLEVKKAEQARIEADSSVRWLEHENERLKAALGDSTSEMTKIKQVVDELMQKEQGNRSSDLQREVDKWKAHAEYYKREYNQAKQLNNEMTKVMSQMTQAVGERSEETSDVTKQKQVLARQLETKTQELKSIKLERDELTKQLEGKQYAGSYFQDKYREASEELKTLKQEHSVAVATSSKLRARIDGLQKEIEDLKAESSRVQQSSRQGVDDSSKIDKYEQHVRDLTVKLRHQDEQVKRTQAFAEKHQAVSDCLNTLLVLESEQTSLYESSCPIKDASIKAQCEAKKVKAQNVIDRLNEIMTEEERPSIAFLQKRPVRS